MSTPTAKAFVVGQTYSCRSIGDHECIYTFTITRRTAHTVWLKERGETEVARRVFTFDGFEAVKPYGSYSMAPILRSGRE